MGGDKESFKYFAFISYSHRDKSIAQKMQHDLESYKLPSAIQKNKDHQLPKKISPIFRDETDLAVGDLDKNLHEELEQSKYLIVICSPNSARPNDEGKNYVNAEVEYFCKINREAYIIPVIIDGKPNEAFCPKLKELGKLALDATKMPRARIVNDIVAKILGLKPDELWQREIRRQRQNAIVRLLLFFFTSMLVAFSSWYYYDWKREKVVYFKDYVDCFGIPQGLFALHREDISSRSQSYRFHFQGYNGFMPWRRKPVLRSVFCVDSQDRPIKDASMLPLHPEIAWRKFAYSESGRLMEIRHLLPNGYETAIFRFSSAGNEFIDVTKRGDDGQWGTRLWKEKTKDLQNKLRRFAVKRDANGCVLQISYLKDNKGTPVSVHGVGREVYEHDELGRVVTRKTYSCNGRQNVGDGSKGDEFRYSFSHAGDFETMIILRKGKVVEKKKNDNGITELTGTQNKKYGKFGELIEEQFFKKDGSVDYIVRYKYDVRLSSPTETTFFAPDGNLTNNAEGWAIETNQFTRIPESGGSYITTRWFDSKHRPVNTKKGYATAIVTFDAKGQPVKTEIFGSNGEKTTDESGYHCARYEYDRFGYLACFSYFGIDGKAVCILGNGKGYHALHLVNDENGNVLESTVYDANGNPTDSDTCRGFAKNIKHYDIEGRLIEEAYFDIKGNKTYPKNGNYHTIKIVYNDNDGSKQESCYHANGTYTRTTIDFNGNILQKSYHNADDSLRQDERGIAKIFYKYDERNHELKRVFSDVNGHRTLSSEGIAGWESIYDKQGNRIEERRFDANEKTCNGNDGIAIIRWRYDKAHRQVAKDFFDANGKPAPNTDGDYGVRWEYDERGNQTASYSTNRNGKCKPDANGVGIVRYKYNEKGMIIRRRFFDVNNMPIKNKEGIGGWVSEYDDAGNETCRMFFDENENPCMCEGRAGERIKFDANGRDFEIMNLDCNGNVAVQYLKINDIEMRFTKAKISYSRDGRMTVLCENIDGEEIMEHVKKIKVFYTQNKDMERLELMNENGVLVNCSMGYARKEIKYNNFREVTEESVWDADGCPALFLPYMIHRTVIHYKRTKSGLTVDCRNYDAENFPTVSKTLGFARLLYRYDMQGRLLSLESFDEHNKPNKAINKKFSKLFLEYDTNGKVKSMLIKGMEDINEDESIKIVFKDRQVEASLLDGNAEVRKTKALKIEEVPKEILDLGHIRYSRDSLRLPKNIVAPYK